MLKVFRDTTTNDEWATYNRYDDQGRVILTVDSPGVTGYNETWAALLDSDDEEIEDLHYLDDDYGLFSHTRYYSEETDLAFPGQPHGYVMDTWLTEGEQGDPVPQSHIEYVAETAGEITVYLVALSVQYGNDDGTGELTTEYVYTYFDDTVQVKQQTVTDPAGGETVTVNDIYGRPVWTKDAAGFITYTEYDRRTGAVVTRIIDVDTTQTTTFADLPSGWSTPTGGGLHLTTLYVVDDQGRTVKMTQKNRDRYDQPFDYITYTVYDDVNHVVRVYPGWNASTSPPTTTGPVVVTREDRARGYTETLTLHVTFISAFLTDGIPNGQEDIIDDDDYVELQSLSRTYVNNAGQVERRDDYFKVDPLNFTYSTAAYAGTQNGHYYTTTYEYDERGRQNRMVVGVGSDALTIYRTVFDSNGRVIGEWVGADDTVTGDWSPTNHGAMILLRTSVYDEGDVGPGRLTSMTETVTHHTSTYVPVLTRTTSYEYDFRGRLITRTLPDPDDNPSTANTPVYRTVYDNLGRVTKESDATGLIDTLGHYTSYEYDDENRTTTVTGPDADGNAGTTGDAPVTVAVRDVRGLLVSYTDPLGRETTYEYDGAGRQVKVTQPDPNPLDSNPAPFTVYAYDWVGNLVSVTDPLGHVTTYDYDRAGRLSIMTQPDPDGEGWLSAPYVTYAYDNAGRRLNLLDPLGNVTTWYYDALGRVTGEVNYLNAARNFTYDAKGRLTEKIDRLNRITRYEYNVFDRVTAEKWYEPGGTTLVKTLSLEYDDVGNLLSAEEPDAAANEYTYDFLGRRTGETQDLVGLTPSLDYTTAYDVHGQRTELAAELDATADFVNSYDYDLLGRLKSVVQQGTGVAAKRAGFAYNLAGQVTAIRRDAATTASELVINSFYDYDPIGRLTKLTHTMAGEPPTSGYGSSAKAGYTYEYDDASRITWFQSRNDNTSTSGAIFDYDDIGQLTYAWGGGIPETNYAYDAGGNRTNQTIDTNNRMIADNLGNTYDYDDEGNLISKTDYLSRTTYYEYDHRNRLVCVTGWLGGPYPEDDGEGTDWGLYSTSDTGSITVGPTVGEGTSWGWGDTSGTVTSGSYAVNVSVAAATEGNNIVVTLVPTSSATFDVNYFVDTASALGYQGRDFYVSGGNSGTIPFSGGSTQYLYITTVDDSLYENTESVKIWLDIDSDPYSETLFEGDIYDNDATSSENVGFSVTGATVAEGSSGVITVTGQAGTLFEWEIEDFSADSGDYNPSAYSGTNWILTDGAPYFTISFSTYDSRDFELRESFCVRVWEVNDPESEVTVEMRIVDKDAPLYEFAEVEYLYDHQNQTVGRIFDIDGEGEEDPTSTFYSYQDGQVVLQFEGTEDTDLAHRYFWNPTAIDQLFADEQVADDLVLWALTDQQGTVRDLATHDSTAHTRTVVLHRNYDAYGNLIAASGILLDGYADEGSNRLTTAATDALFNYTGRFFDTSTWLQYNLNRWYDAQTGRWISEDPIGFDGDLWNLYRYVGNSPTNAVDPTGEFALSATVKPGDPRITNPFGGVTYTITWAIRDDIKEKEPLGPKQYTVNGWIVQHVKITRSVNLTPDVSDEYWEAWRVVNGTVTPANDTLWNRGSGPRTCGYAKWVGRAKFIRNLDISTWGRIPAAGTLPATRRPPRGWTDAGGFRHELEIIWDDTVTPGVPTKILTVTPQ